jgi:tetratricopeptide (TPR) repeat protein
MNRNFYCRTFILILLLFFPFSVFSQSPEAAQSAFGKGVEFYKNRQYDRAIHYFSKSLEIHGKLGEYSFLVIDHPDARLLYDMLIGLYMNNESYKEARKTAACGRKAPEVWSICLKTQS